MGSVQYNAMCIEGLDSTKSICINEWRKNGPGGFSQQQRGWSPRSACRGLSHRRSPGTLKPSRRAPSTPCPQCEPQAPTTSSSSHSSPSISSPLQPFPTAASREAIPQTPSLCIILRWQIHLTMQQQNRLQFARTLHPWQWLNQDLVFHHPSTYNSSPASIRLETK